MIRRAICLLSLSVFSGSFGHGQSAEFTTSAEQRAVLDKYCVVCHNDKLQSGGLSLASLEKTLDGGHAAEAAPKWEKVIRKLRAGMMPPSGMPRPDAATLNLFAKSLEDTLDRLADANPNPGRPALHRLNRVEYANSVRDLLGLRVDMASFLPVDDKSQGFDNMADVLTFSPTLLDGFVRAADQVSRLAVGDPGMSPISTTFHIPKSLTQLDHVEGAPFGTRGGMSTTYNFPCDGEYVFKSTFYEADEWTIFGALSRGEQLEIAINGVRAALLNFNPGMSIHDDLRTLPIKVKAGPQVISVAFLRKAAGPVEDFLAPYGQSLAEPHYGAVAGLTGRPHLKDFSIIGPQNSTGPGDTISRRKIFVCRPATESEESACAEKIIESLATQAYRRPLVEKDRKYLFNIYRVGRSRGNFEAGIRLLVEAVLADPEFVIRFERTPSNVKPGANYLISDLELASRLSYFLWSSAPDAELLKVASEHRLRDPGVLEGEVRRMLADPRAESLSTVFASEWLHLQNLDSVEPDLDLYPNFDDNLAQAMKRETQLFFGSIVKENRSVLDLLTANYTFVNERLAEHYKIPNVSGERFRRVTLTDPNRFGILGQASILTLTSVSNRTSPVQRGKWVMDVLLGTPPPTPPANVPALKETAKAGKVLSVRELMEEHRANPACAACHKLMDPIGFSLENFDPTGAWRVHDGAFVVNPAGKMFDGTSLKGPVTLRNAILSHSDAFLRTFVENLLMYGIGRVTDYYDMPVVRSIVREANRNDNRFASIVMGIVNSPPFQMRRAEGNSNSAVAGLGPDSQKPGGDHSGR